MYQHKFLDIILLVEEMVNVYETYSNSIRAILRYNHFLEIGNMEQLVCLSVFEVETKRHCLINLVNFIEAIVVRVNPCRGCLCDPSRSTGQNQTLCLTLVK